MVFNDTLEIQQLFADILGPEGYTVSLHTFRVCLKSGTIAVWKNGNRIQVI